MRKFTVKLSLAMLLGSSVFAAGVPNTINYQGRLTDAAGDAVPDGAILVKFQIYNAATGGTVLWNSLFQTINTVDGLFSYDLGSNVALPDLFGTDTVRYLGITVGTDSEISPRSRFTSNGYVFRSQKSDLALDADSLGGLQPAFYLDWGNMTSIPAGFADGVDDEGIDQAFADGRYVNRTGDVMTGNLRMQRSGLDHIVLDVAGGTGLQIFQASAPNNLAAHLYAPSNVGDLLLLDNQNPPVKTVEMFAWTRGGELQLSNLVGTNTIRLQGNTTGDNSVVFPADAINSLEMFDEPGIAQGRFGSSIILNTSSMVDLTTVTITTPSSGYILLKGRVMIRLGGTTGKNWASVQIDETAGGAQTSSLYGRSGLDGYTNTGINFFEGGAQRTYFKSAGTYTFRIEAQLYPISTGWADCWFPTLTALFIPTSYGSVSTIAEQPGDHPDAKAVSVTGPDGSTVTAYKMDLRYYEEKARAARITEQKAELARAEAELELLRAKATSDIK